MNRTVLVAGANPLSANVNVISKMPPVSVTALNASSCPAPKVAFVLSTPDKYVPASSMMNPSNSDASIACANVNVAKSAEYGKYASVTAITMLCGAVGSTGSVGSNGFTIT